MQANSVLCKEPPMYSTDELALRLRMRQAELTRQIADEDKRGITLRMRELLRRKLNVDQLLSDLAGEMGWPPGYHKSIDEEICKRVGR